MEMALALLLLIHFNIPQFRRRRQYSLYCQVCLLLKITDLQCPLH